MNINIKLDKNFTAMFNKFAADYGQKMLQLNGFSEKQLNYTDFIDNFVDKNTVADASIDGNANVNTKDITSLIQQMNKPHSKLLAFNKIFMELNKKFGYKVACDWLKNEWDGHFYLHDANSSTYVPYCFAYDIEQLVKKGLFFIKNFNAQPPKHLGTYTDFVGEFVSWVSNRSSGACGLPSFLVYSYYFWRKDIEEGYLGMKKGSKEAEYYRDQEFQRIIYKLNQPYLRVNQSAFTNFSILDRDYLIELFGGKEFPDGTFIIDEIEEIIEYEKAFMEVVSQVRTQNMMTFPVLTYSLLRSKDGKWGDEEFARWCCKHNMKWNDSNFYISDNVTSLSNCCVTGESIIKVYDKETNEEQIYSISQFISKFDKDRVVEFIAPIQTGYYVKSYNYTTKEWQNKDIVGVIKKYNNYDFLYKIILDDETEIDVTPDHTMELIDEQGIHIQVSARNLDYNIKQGKQYKVIKEDGSEHTFKSVEKRTTDEVYVYCLHIADFNNFNVNGVNVGNCRLISDIDELGYFNSIGGTALEVGSVKVNTVNLARIAYENETKQGYLNQLGEEIVLCLQALDIVRGIIKRNSEKGLLPNYNLDVIKFESQYNTIGVIGIYEVLQKYGMIEVDEFNNHSYTDEGIAFAKAIFDKIIEVKEQFRKDNGCSYKINIEQIPAERAAAILMYKDQEFFPNEKYELPTYGNQWIPLAVKCTLSEKIKISALLDQFCNGGSISHINLSAPFNNFDQAWKILNQVADAGVKYFAFCVRISACKNNHGFFGDKCPVCGELKYTTYQRIVGFLVAETSYSSERKAQFKMRDWFEINSGDDLTAK